MTDDERRKMSDFLDAIPERENIIHGDFHPNNIGESCGQLVILDMAETGYGHPVFDFMASYYDLVVSGQTVGVEHPEITKKYFGLDIADLKKLWDMLLDRYFTKMTAEKKKFFNEMINMMLGFKLMLFPVLHPNFPKEKHDAWLNMGRERFVDNYDEIMAGIGELNEFFAEE